MISHILLAQVNGNHETMNVEGDFRYVDSGAFDECLDFLDYLEDYRYEWERAFVSWIATSEQREKYRKQSQTYWGQWNLVKVLNFSIINRWLFYWFCFMWLYWTSFLITLVKFRTEAKGGNCQICPTETRRSLGM